MSFTDTLKIAGQYCLPKHALSRLVGKLAAAEAGTLTTRIIEYFIGRYGVDMSEALHEEAAHYKSFNAFFTRPLKEGIRPVVEDPMTLALPVDGTVSQLGPISQGRIIQAKGHDYSARELLGAMTIWWPRSKTVTSPPSTWRPRTTTASICRWTVCSKAWYSCRGISSRSIP
ncbi:phosphatidylserine decarboxylase [Aeromonas schubertii]|uniref:Phosphatidylserine decarboxylase n=1 Tax=Aeromonas schubertii TaxID=652 RepID=A0A0S2SCJ7_9GAMM|nr:phosphatidylserine decarboxylase [Aeromonas schubertii]